MIKYFKIARILINIIFMKRENKYTILINLDTNDIHTCTCILGNFFS